MSSNLRKSSRSQKRKSMCGDPSSEEEEVVEEVASDSDSSFAKLTKSAAKKKGSSGKNSKKKAKKKKADDGDSSDDEEGNPQVIKDTTMINQVLLDLIMKAPIFARCFLVNPSDARKVVPSMNYFRGKEYELQEVSSDDSGLELKDCVESFLSDECRTMDIELAEDASGSAIYVRPSSRYPSTLEDIVSPRQGSKSGISDNLFIPVYDDTSMKSIILENSFKVGLETGEVDRIVIDIIISKKKMKSVRRSAASSAATSTVNSRVRTGDCTFNITLLEPTRKQKPKRSSPTDVPKPRVESSDSIVAFSIPPPNANIGMIRAAILAKAMTQTAYDGKLGPSSRLYVKQTGVGHGMVTVPETSSGESLALFDKYRKKNTDNEVSLLVSFGEKKPDAVAFGNGEDDANVPDPDVDNDEVLAHSQGVDTGAGLLDSPVAKRHSSNRAEREESQDNLVSSQSKMAMVNAWLLKAISIESSSLYMSLSPNMFKMASIKLKNAIGKPVYEKYTFVDGESDTWPPSIDQLIDETYWDEPLISHRVGGKKPEKGEYPIGDDGKPLSVEGEGGPGARAQDGSKAMASAIAESGKSNERGLIGIANAMLGGAAKQRVSLSCAWNGASIATPAEDENEKMSSVMSRLKNRNPNADVFRLSDDDVSKVRGDSATHFLSYSICDRKQGSAADGLVLTKTADELRQDDCTVGSLRIVGSSDISIEVSIKEKPVGTVVADLF